MFTRDGFQVYDDSWFAGHHLLGYSLISPALTSALGVRVTGALAATVSTFVFERLVVGWRGQSARPAAYWFALGAVADLFIGRLAFSLGVTVALTTLLALQRGRPRLAVCLAALCAATDPVAALFLALAGAAAWLARPRSVPPIAMAIVAGGLALGLASIFPEGGTEPTSVATLIAIVAFSALLAIAVGRRERAIQIGCVGYALAGVASFVLATPMDGSPIGRLGPELAAPLLVGSLAAVWPRPRWHLTAAAALLLTAFVAWQWYGPVREVKKTIADPASSADYYTPLVNALNERADPSARIEVPFTRSHWESVYVAQHFALVRGWETQLDNKYDNLFYEPQLSFDRYHDWLTQNAVSFVALPDVALAPSGQAEAGLIRSQPQYLKPVWKSAHWTLFALQRPQPISSPARLVSLGPNGFVIDASSPGSSEIRLHWTPYWTVRTDGCVQRSPDGWTQVVATRPGPVDVQASLSVGGLLGRDKKCAQPR